MHDKQKLFRLIRKLGQSEPAASPPRKLLQSEQVLQAVCANSLEASRMRAQMLDGDAALLDLEDADVDLFLQARLHILYCSISAASSVLHTWQSPANGTKKKKGYWKWVL